ncbi:MAG: hypothetical protein JJT75_07085 [Opitutales bacterium]|nr:hypothetical protein [Opitutales bacterium]MCH8540299.1 hypothetical protein [Opitutales bacterium]
MKEIRIEGGGICGLALGQALAAQKVPVTLLEKGRYPRHRVCGEFLAGITPATLRVLGLQNLFANAPLARTVVWYKGETRIARHTLPGEVPCQSRFVLDSELARRFTAAGGNLQTGQRVNPHEPALEGTVRTLGKASGQSARLGLKAHFQDLVLEEVDLEMHLGKNAYVGLTKVENGYVNVCGLFEQKRGLQAQKDQWLPTYLRASGLHRLADRISNAHIRPGSFCGVSGFSFGLPETEKEKAASSLSLGDCHAMIPPFTGNGMTMAMESAALAFPYLLEYSQGQTDWPQTKRRLAYARDHSFNGRMQRAVWLQKLLQKEVTQNVLCKIAQRNLFPFTLIYRLLH